MVPRGRFQRRRSGAVPAEVGIREDEDQVASRGRAGVVVAIYPTRVKHSPRLLQKQTGKGGEPVQASTPAGVVVATSLAGCIGGVDSRVPRRPSHRPGRGLDGLFARRAAGPTYYGATAYGPIPTMALLTMALLTRAILTMNLDGVVARHAELAVRYHPLQHLRGQCSGSAAVAQRGCS